MRNFEGISFIWAIALLGVIGLVYGIRAGLGWANVTRDAREDWAYKSQNNMIDPRLTQSQYGAVYKRVHGPRMESYIFAGVAALFVLTPIVMWLMEWALNAMYHLSGQSRTIEPGWLLWQSLIFFGLLIIWALIGYVVARRYHAKRPGSWAVEVERELTKSALTKAQHI